MRAKIPFRSRLKIAAHSILPTVRAEFALAVLLTTLGLGASEAQAAKPEDVFKGKIIITKDRLPMRF